MDAELERVLPTLAEQMRITTDAAWRILVAGQGAEAVAGVFVFAYVVSCLSFMSMWAWAKQEEDYAPLLFFGGVMAAIVGAAGVYAIALRLLCPEYSALHLILSTIKGQ